MTTLTIPKKMAQKDDLIILPRKEYEELLNLKKAVSRNQSWFWTKEWQKKEREADEDIKAGRLSGPLTTAEALIKHLNKLKEKSI